MIAALYVEEHGIYANRPDVECWGVAKDARTYKGSHAVVAHPPCERWGKYWFGGPSCKVRKIKGDDNGCFAAALASVREFGGILEHPAASAAWAAFGLAAPPHRGGWIVADFLGGWTCHVEQGHYGHRARKATWLYANAVTLRDLAWGASQATVRIDEGFHSADERKRARGTRTAGDAIERMGKRERLATPPAFAELLLSIARTSTKGTP